MYVPIIENLPTLAKYVLPTPKHGYTQRGKSKLLGRYKNINGKKHQLHATKGWRVAR